MAYEPRFPPDTNHEIDAFIESLPHELRSAAVDALDEEVKKLCANPLLGTIRYGGPFENRRIHLVLLTIGTQSRSVEFAYKIFEQPPVLVFSGFREKEPPIAF